MKSFYKAAFTLVWVRLSCKGKAWIQNCKSGDQPLCLNIHKVCVRNSLARSVQAVKHQNQEGLSWAWAMDLWDRLHSSRTVPLHRAPQQISWTLLTKGMCLFLLTETYTLFSLISVKVTQTDNTSSCLWRADKTALFPLPPPTPVCNPLLLSSQPYSRFSSGI